MSKKRESESKPPKIDLKELRRAKAENKRARRKFLDYYAGRIREGTA